MVLELELPNRQTNATCTCRHRHKSIKWFTNANLQKRMKGTSTSNPLATTIAVRRPCLSTSANFEKLPSPFKKTSRAMRRYTPTHADEDIYIALTRRTCWRCCCFRRRRIICFFHLRYFLRVLLDNAERLQHNSISTAN